MSNYKKEQFTELYVEQKLLQKEIAAELDISIGTVASYLRLFEIPLRTRTQTIALAQSKGALYGPPGAGVLGPKHFNWKGGRVAHHSGYVLVWLHPDDPFAQMAEHNKRGTSYVPEHRIVMARHLGRLLQPWEVVHHKNGIRDDNRIENLELNTKGAHMKSHSQGYQDGFNAGYYDGKGERIKTLELRITKLEATRR